MDWGSDADFERDAAFRVGLLLAPETACELRAYLEPSPTSDEARRAFLARLRRLTGSRPYSEMSAEERETHKARNRRRYREMSPDERAACLERMRERWRKYARNMTPEQREARRASARKYYRRKRGLPVDDAGGTT